MENSENKRLTELLSTDSESREFFSKLSPELRKALMKKDVNVFESLKRCADCSGGESMANRQTMNPACPTGECTGLAAQGGDMSTEEFEEYKQIFPFADP
jgi:hypothetical protein